MRLEKIKRELVSWKGIFNSGLKKTRILQYQHLKQVKMYLSLFLFHLSFPLEFDLLEFYLLDLLGLITKRSKFHQKVCHVNAL